MANLLKDIEPEKIRPNDENPRMYFRERELSALIESIDADGGVLVPIYVFQDPDAPGSYVLIDGERRWRAASQLGLESIPAIVRDTEPNSAQNVVEMFNIHHVREAWEEMPTARALRAVVERKGTSDVGELSRLTGISKEQIGRFMLILDLPKKYQAMIEKREIPMNFFVELDRNVIKPLARSRADLAKEFSASKLRSAFVDKRKSGALEDLVDMRNVRKVINRAAADAGSPQGSSSIDDALRTLFNEKTTTIEEIYEATAAFQVESSKLASQAARIAPAFEEMLAAAKTDGERRELLTTLRTTRDSLDEVLDTYDAE